MLDTYILFVTSNHQTTNFVFPNFFHECFSVLAVEKENKLFIGSKQLFSQLWTNEKIVFFFNCSNWEKIGENKIGGLVVWCHKQDIRLLFTFFFDYHKVASINGRVFINYVLEGIVWYFPLFFGASIFFLHEPVFTLDNYIYQTKICTYT